MVADYLESLGLENYLVEVGGDLRTKGKKPDNTDWSIAVERPDSAQGSVLQLIYPKNAAVATSGDYRTTSKSMASATRISSTPEMATPSVIN